MAERRDAERAAGIARQAGIDEGTIRKRELRKNGRVPKWRTQETNF
jgi:hypothetical protein